MHFSKSVILCHLNFGNQTPHLYLHAIHILCCFTTAGFILMLLFFKVLQFCFHLVYQTVFLLDECSGLVNLPHQFHYKLNMALILKLYLFSFFSQFFNGMADLIQVSLATIFYEVSVFFLTYIFLGFN